MTTPRNRGGRKKSPLVEEGASCSVDGEAPSSSAVTTVPTVSLAEGESAGSVVTPWTALFQGMRLAGLALNAIALIGVLALSAGAILVPPLWLAGGYLLGQVALALAESGQTRSSRSLPVVMKLFFLLTMASVWDFLVILLLLPFIAISILAGPMMLLVMVVALVMLAVYCLELVIGDIRGWSSFDNIRQALFGLVLFLGSGAILWFRFADGEDRVETWAVNTLVALRRKLDKAIRDVT